MIEIHKNSSEKVLGFILSQTLSRNEYLNFSQFIEKMILNKGTESILIILKDFKGISLDTSDDEVRFLTKHFNSINKVSILGSSRFSRCLQMLCRPFSKAKIKHYRLSNSETAWKWAETH